MSSDKQKSLAAMRTFARDVAREKGIEEAPPKPEPKQEAKKPVPRPPKPIETKVPEKSQPKSIPPFHEINKKKAVKTDIKAEPKKAKKQRKLKDKKGIEPTKKVGGGTVITDTKNPKRSFFKDAQTSLAKWFNAVKKSLTPKKKNAYVVAKTDRRKGVVQKATSKTGTIFTADSETMREQIKARQRADKHEHDEDISWSPYTEAGYPLLEGDIVESVDPRIEKISVTPKTHAVPKPVIKQTEKIPELQEKKTAPIEPFVEDVKPETETPAEINQPSEQRATDVEAEESQEPIAVESEPEFVATEGDREEKKLSLKDTNTVAMLFVGAVLAIGLFGYILFGIFNIGGNNSDGNESNMPQNLYPSATTLQHIELSELTAKELVNKANVAVTENQNMAAEYIFVDENDVEVASDIILNLLRTYTEDNFAEVITNIHFVETAGEQRAILIQAPSESITLGSMLNWEPTLFIDIGALLDVPNVPLSAGEYVDAQIGELDVRTLVFDNDVLLLYSVINETTVVITDDVTILNEFSE